MSQLMPSAKCKSAKKRLLKPFLCPLAKNIQYYDSPKRLRLLKTKSEEIVLKPAIKLNS